jgi:hypothetical protein
VAVKSDDWRHLQAGIADGVIHRGFVIYNGTRAFAAANGISVVPPIRGHTSTLAGLDQITKAPIS